MTPEQAWDVIGWMIPFIMLLVLILAVIAMLVMVGIVLSEVVDWIRKILTTHRN